MLGLRLAELNSFRLRWSAGAIPSCRAVVQSFGVAAGAIQPRCAQGQARLVLRVRLPDAPIHRPNSRSGPLCMRAAPPLGAHPDTRDVGRHDPTRATAACASPDSEETKGTWPSEPPCFKATAAIHSAGPTLENPPWQPDQARAYRARASGSPSLAKGCERRGRAGDVAFDSCCQWGSRDRRQEGVPSTRRPHGVWQPDTVHEPAVSAARAL
jgi:hypothetical protein